MAVDDLKHAERPPLLFKGPIEPGGQNDMLTWRERPKTRLLRDHAPIERKPAVIPRADTHVRRAGRGPRHRCHADEWRSLSRARRGTAEHRRRHPEDARHLDHVVGVEILLV